jgi:hypothetical protein
MVAVAALNIGTLVGGAFVWEHMDQVLDTREQSWDGNDVNPAVITYRNQQSCSLLVFDTDGKRLRGVKVQDQSGRVLPMRNRDC